MEFKGTYKDLLLLTSIIPDFDVSVTAIEGSDLSNIVCWFENPVPEDVFKRFNGKKHTHTYVAVAVEHVLRDGWMTPLDQDRSDWEGVVLRPRVKTKKRVVETRYTDFVCSGFIRSIYQAHKGEEGRFVIKTCHQMLSGPTPKVILDLDPALYYRQTCVLVKCKLSSKSRSKKCPTSEQDGNNNRKHATSK